MKNLLLFPPIWHPTNPCLGIPTLMAQLRKEGFDAEAIDLNIEFYDEILKKTYLEKNINDLKKIQSETSVELKKYTIENKKIEDYPIEVQEVLLKNKAIMEFLRNKSALLKTIPNLVEMAVSDIKNPKKFYNPKSFIHSFSTINSALEIASLPYAPARILFYQYQNPLLEFDYNNIKYNVFSKSTNIFIDFYKKWLPKIQRKKPKYIGISINSTSQIIPGLTLANLLKENTNAHISIGGNYFSRIIDDIVNYPEFFDIFADSISVNEGEKPVIELIKHLNEEISIDDVPNLIYKKNNEIIINKKCIPYKLDEMPIPSFDDYNFSKYLTPEIVLPMQTTRGCYWGKCAFCDIPYGKQHSVKSVDKLIEEIKKYNKKYGITHFDIVDDSIAPSYFEELAEKIIKNKLKITYHTCARLEKSLTEEILKKASKSGLKMILWGLESGSKRILELTNKGIDANERFEVLKRASNAGIWNHAFSFYGFPTETSEEAKETIKMFETNSEIIDSCGIVNFRLVKHSKIKNNPDNYGIKCIKKEQKEFSTILDYEAEGMNENEIKNIEMLLAEQNKKIYGLSLCRFINCFEYLILYISHYGIDWVRNYKIDGTEFKQ